MRPTLSVVHLDSLKPLGMKVQFGSAREIIFDVLEKTKSSVVVILYIIFTLIVVYKDQIPESIHVQGDSLIGRLFSVLFVSFITIEYGWILGLFSALAVALFFGSVVSQIEEHFTDQTTHVISNSKKWFVERLFKEEPTLIQEEHVNTQAVQDDSRGGQSFGGGVSNSSVSR